MTNLPRTSLLALLVALAAPAGAQTIVVNTSADVVDFGGAQQVADLPGPDGKVSLKEAGLASDNTPGVQTIAFQIPQSEWLYQQFFPGRAVLKPFLGFRVFDTAIVDARTQTAFTGDTNPAGGEVVIWENTYLIDNVGGAIHGFDSSSIHLSGGSGNVVQGNTLSGIEVFDSDDNLIGGSGPGQGNSGGFIQIDRANGNLVLGNTVSRVRVLGWVGGGQPATGNVIGGPNAADRNFIVGLGTWSSEGFPGGFAVQLFDSIGTVIENNSIGTTPDGLAQGHQATTSGILFDGENHDVTIRDNRIAGILGHGIGPHYAGWLVGSAITFVGTGSGAAIQGNTIGLDANGDPTLGSVTGVATNNYFLGPYQDVLLGGSGVGEGNEIAGHLLSGVSVANTWSGLRISRNSIHDNGALGIDLIDAGFQVGVTPNDPLDADSGGNGLQNFPTIFTAVPGAGTLHLTGTLASAPSKAYTLEFFASPTADASGFGEGQVFLGSTSVATGVGGNAAFDVTLASSAPAGWVVAATATDESTGSTSEFSAVKTIGDDPVTSFCAQTKPTSVPGCAAVLSASGPSLSGDAWSLANVPLGPSTTSTVGILIYTHGVGIGPSGVSLAVPFGTLCLSNFQRSAPACAPLVLAGTANSCGNAFGAFSPACNANALGLAAGEDVNVQGWYRDPQVGPEGANLSNAIFFTALP